MNKKEQNRKQGKCISSDCIISQKKVEMHLHFSLSFEEIKDFNIFVFLVLKKKLFIDNTKACVNRPFRKYWGARAELGISCIVV